VAGPKNGLTGMKAEVEVSDRRQRKAMAASQGLFALCRWMNFRSFFFFFLSGLSRIQPSSGRSLRIGG
jgi:hypothetical protein